MKYNGGKRIWLLDEVLTASGVLGTVVGMEEIAGRNFVKLLVSGRGYIWASTNAVQEIKRLPVIHL